MVPNGLAFSCRERTAQDHAKKAPISCAKRSAVTPGWAATVQRHCRRLVTADVSLALFASQIVVFHFPRVIERVKGGVPSHVPVRPFRLLASLLALGVVVPYCLAIGITIRPQSLVSQQRIIAGGNPDPTRPIPLYGQRMPDDVVAVASAAARPPLHFSRHARTHRIEKRPARPHQRQLTLHFFARHSLLVDA